MKGVIGQIVSDQPRAVSCVTQRCTHRNMCDPHAAYTYPLLFHLTLPHLFYSLRGIGVRRISEGGEGAGRTVGQGKKKRMTHEGH